MCALAQLLGGSVPWSSQTHRWRWQVSSSQGPHFYPFKRWIQGFLFFSHLGLHLTFQDFSSILECGLAITLAIPSGFRDAFCQTQRFIFLQVPEGGHEQDLNLQWEELCSLSPHPPIHLLKRCGKRACHWRLRQVLLSTSASSSSIVTSFPVCQDFYQMASAILIFKIMFCLIAYQYPG